MLDLLLHPTTVRLLSLAGICLAWILVVAGTIHLFDRFSHRLCHRRLRRERAAWTAANCRLARRGFRRAM